MPDINPQLHSDLDRNLECRARRAARRRGLIVKRSRRQISSDNRGGYMLIDLRTNNPVAGFRFDMSAQEVLDRCN